MPCRALQRALRAVMFVAVMKRTLLVVIAIAVAACAQRPAPTEDARPAETAAAATVKPEPESPPTGDLPTAEKGMPNASGHRRGLLPDQATDALDPKGALSLPNLRKCVGKCVDDNKMRGVGEDQINADCRNECRDNCLKYCERPRGDRPQEFREACRRDCSEQIQRLLRR